MFVVTHNKMLVCLRESPCLESSFTGAGRVRPATASTIIMMVMVIFIYLCLPTFDFLSFARAAEKNVCSKSYGGTRVTKSFPTTLILIELATVSLLVAIFSFYITIFLSLVDTFACLPACLLAQRPRLRHLRLLSFILNWQHTTQAKWCKALAQKKPIQCLQIHYDNPALNIYVLFAD